MRNPNQLQRALLGRLAAPLGHAVLGDDVVDFVLAGADVGASAERRHDARNAVVFGDRAQDDKGLAAARTVGGAQEVGLAAGACVRRKPQALGAALPEQVNLQGGVDGDELVVQSRQRPVVGEVHWMDFQRRIAVHEAVELARAEGEGGGHFSGQVILAPVGAGAAFDQGQNAVANHLGVNARVVLVRELHDHGRDVADVVHGLRGYGSRASVPEQQKEGGLKLPRHAFHLWFATTAPFVAQLLFGFGKLLATLEAG